MDEELMWLQKVLQDSGNIMGATSSIIYGSLTFQVVTLKEMEK